MLRYALVKKLLHQLAELILDLHLQRVQLPLNGLLALGRALQIQHSVAPQTLFEPNTNLEFHL